MRRLVTWALARIGAFWPSAGSGARGSQWLDAIALDVRFGIRMLVKHRGLTAIGAFAMAVAIAVGVTTFAAVSAMLEPALPFPGGDRIVALKLAGATAGSDERPPLHELDALRRQLVTVEQVGAFHDVERNLAAAETAPEPVLVAEITASAFALTGTPSLLGRYLVPADESAAAPPVIVIGYDAWRLRFGAAPDVVGRTVALGGVPRTIVGVMPDGFRFPFDHQFWVPLREDALDGAARERPRVTMFGRLAPGVTLDRAQAEFAAVASRIVDAHPEDGPALRPAVVPYTRDLLDATALWALRAGQMLVGALTLLVALNLAIFVYARTVARLGEIAVRSALGASRGRILAQLFIEALALTIVGACAGLALAHYALGVMQWLAHGLPFWIRFDLSAGAVIYAFALAVLAAVVMGVLPGLTATGAGVTTSLHELHGRSGTRLGTTWTTLIVAQVAAAVAVLPASVFVASRVIRMETTGPGFPAGSFVVATAELDADGRRADPARARTVHSELMARLRTEPGVVGVTYSSGIPGVAAGERIRFEDDAGLRNTADQGPDAGSTNSMVPSVVTAGTDLFATYGAVILAGRDFLASDVGVPVVVVNRSFAEMYLRDGNAVGLRFRYVRDGADSTQASWYQIVGVVRDFPAYPANLTRDGEPTIYHPAAIGDLDPVTLSVRFAGGVPAGFGTRFRAIGAEVDPALQLRNVGPLADRYDAGRRAWRSLAWAIALVTTGVLLLSAAGIYALMSFTVAQRTREIGIRTALGAPPSRLMRHVFGRAAWQIAGGVVVGSILSGGAFAALGFGPGRAVPLLLAVAVVMGGVGLLAAVGPARRASRIQPTEALRAEA